MENQQLDAGLGLAVHIPVRCGKDAEGNSRRYSAHGLLGTWQAGAGHSRLNDYASRQSGVKAHLGMEAR